MTAKKDRREKNRVYERAGVKAYWIVDPFHYTIEVFTLSDTGAYGEADLYGKEDEMKVGILDELEIPLQSIFLG